MDLNKVMLIGRLTKDPDVKSLANGDMVATFSLATSKQWTDKATGQKKSQSEFHNVVAWRKLADILQQYAQKGQQVFIEGALQTRTWDDPTGKKQYKTEVVASNIILLGGLKTASAEKVVQHDEYPSNFAQAAEILNPSSESSDVQDLPF